MKSWILIATIPHTKGNSMIGVNFNLEIFLITFRAVKSWSRTTLYLLVPIPEVRNFSILHLLLVYLYIIIQVI